MTVSKKLLILFLFLLTSITGCKTIQPSSSEWLMPVKPCSYPVKFEQKDEGLFINKQSSINLLKNIEELDAYIEKLELLVKEMKKYYGEK